MAMDSEYNWDLSDYGDVTFTLFFGFAYFNKNTQFQSNSHNQCGKYYFPQLFTFFSTSPIHEGK